MAIVATMYTHAPKIMWADGDWLNDTLKVALVTSSYTPSVAHTVWADVSANEVSSGDGYTTGGYTITSPTLSNTAADAENPSWVAMTKTFRYGVLYISGTVFSLTNPLLAYYLLDDSPADIVLSGENYEIPFNANGIFTFS